MGTKARVAGGASAAVLLLAGALVAKWEGVRYVPYRDQGGVLTVCWGHTGPDVIAGKQYTKSECIAFRDRDMGIANGAVRRCIPVPMLVQIESALTDAAFNAGPAVVCGSTLQRKAMANDWPGACAELSRWIHVNRMVSKGLVNRRADDRAVCEGRAVMEEWK
jgi:lysozyme